MRLLLQRCDRRFQLIVDHIHRYRTDVLVADDTVRIDQETFRRSVDTEVNGCLSAGVRHQHAVGIAVGCQPRFRIVRRILVVVADQGHAQRRRFCLQYRMLHPTFYAPAGEDVQQIGFAHQRRATHGLRRFVQQRQFEIRRRLVDQRRRDRRLVMSGVPPDTEAEQAGQQQETDEGQQTSHARVSDSNAAPTGSGASALAGRRTRNRRSPALTKPPNIIISPPNHSQRMNGL